MKFRTAFRGMINVIPERSRHTKHFLDNHIPINPRIRKQHIIERSQLLIRNNRVLPERIDRNIPLRRLQINIRTPIQKTLQQLRIPHKIMLALLKHRMQSIDFLVSINLSRIRTIIQHPVHNLNPSGQILVPKRPEQVLSPVNARMRFDSPHKIIQSPVPNDPARSPRSLAHFPLPSFVYMRSVSHGVLHTIITRIPVTPQKLFRINFTRKILVPQLTIFCFRYVPHVPQTIPRLTRMPLHPTPPVPLGIDMNVRPISSIIKRPNPHLIRTRLRQIKLSFPDLLELPVAGVGPHLLNLLLRILRTLIRIRKKITILVIPIRVRLTPRRHPTLIQTPVLRKPGPRIPVIPHHPATIILPLHQTQRTTIPMIHRLPIPIPRPIIQRPLHILLGILVTKFLLPLLRRRSRQNPRTSPQDPLTASPATSKAPSQNTLEDEHTSNPEPDYHHLSTPESPEEYKISNAQTAHTVSNLQSRSADTSTPHASTCQ